MLYRFRSLIVVIAMALLMAACGASADREAEESAPAPSQTQEREPSLADIEGPSAQADESEGELPPGHPPVPSRSPSMAVPPPPPGSGRGASALTWTVPEGWVEEPPASSMRRAQYRVPGSGGDGQLAVFYFGPGQGGDARSNAERWAGQFVQPDGRSSQEVMQTDELQVNGIDVLVVEVTGTYTGGMMGGMMGQSEPRPDAMLLGAVARGPDANWFFKLTGPEATLREQKESFLKLIRSLETGS